MGDLTRRSFIEKTLGVIVIGSVAKVSFGNSRESEINRAWGQAIKENNLKDEVSALMKKNKATIGYFTGYGNLSVRQDLNHRNIVGYDMPIKNLEYIKEQLESGEKIITMHESTGLH